MRAHLQRPSRDMSFSILLLFKKDDHLVRSYLFRANMVHGTRQPLKIRPSTAVLALAENRNEIKWYSSNIKKEETAVHVWRGLYTNNALLVVQVIVPDGSSSVMYHMAHVMSRQYNYHSVVRVWTDSNSASKSVKRFCLAMKLPGFRSITAGVAKDDPNAICRFIAESQALDWQ